MGQKMFPPNQLPCVDECPKCPIRHPYRRSFKYQRLDQRKLIRRFHSRNSITLRPKTSYVQSTIVCCKSTGHLHEGMPFFASSAESVGMIQ